jgi:hypothetical protein
MAPEADKADKVKAGPAEILDKMKAKMQKEIRQSIVEATIEKYRHIGDKSDIVVRTYAQRSLEKKNEELDVLKIIADKKEEELMKKELNEAAEVVVQRIDDKLRGTEFPIRQQKHKGSGSAQHHLDGYHAIMTNHKQDIEDQVDLLIQQATNHENLAQCYPGWCPYW